MGKTTALKQSIYSLAEKSGAVRLLQSLGRDNGRQVYVLAYHRVDLPGGHPWLNPELVNATPAQFGQQITLLQKEYHPVSIEQVIEAGSGGKKLPGHAVLVTVDDGYQDFRETILPICRRAGVRPLLFVPTGYVGQGTFWWDKLYQVIFLSGWKEIPTPDGETLDIAGATGKEAAIERLSREIKGSDMEGGIHWLDELHRHYCEENAASIGDRGPDVLDWDELRTVRRQGADVAMHTHTHPILSRVSAERIHQEIRQSRAVMQTQLDEVLPVFAYPDGVAAAISAEARRAVREEGIQLAFTMMAGRADLDRDPHDFLPRLGTWSKLNLGHFHLRLTPYFARVLAHRENYPLQ